MKNNDIKSINNQSKSFIVGTVESIELTALFILFLEETMHRFLENIGHTFMYPLTAGTALIRAILAWRQARIDNGNNGTMAHAIVEILGALAITTAVLGSFVATTVFASISPIIFATIMAAKTLFHAGSALYYWYLSSTANNDEDKRKYKTAARSEGIGALAGALATLAVGLVMLASKPIYAILGITAGVIGTVFCIYKAVKLPVVIDTSTPIDNTQSLTKNKLFSYGFMKKKMPSKHLDVTENTSGIQIKSASNKPLDINPSSSLQFFHPKPPATPPLHDVLEPPGAQLKQA